MASDNFIGNLLYTEQAVSIERVREYEEGKAVQTGVFIQPNRDIVIRIKAPANAVLLGKAQLQGEVKFHLANDGVLEGLLPFDPNCTGPQTFDLYLNGLLFLSPWLPIYWTGNRPCNYVEVPDPDDGYLLIRDVPHGAYGREIFYSQSLKRHVRVTVYTPPGYMRSTEELPVLYLLNGGSDNETSWQYSGRMANILDNLYALGKARPMIVVMCNSMLRHSESVPPGIPMDTACRDMLINDCIPYIEKTYRAKTGQRNRAIAGLSMGAYMSCDIAFGSPELFGYVGFFTACMTQSKTMAAYERPYHIFIKDKQNIADHFRLLYRSTTRREDHFEFFEADDRLFAESGVDTLPCYYRRVYAEHTSKWSSWRQGFRDFAQMLFL